MRVELVGFTDGSAVAHGEKKGLGGMGLYFPDFMGNALAISKGYYNTKTGRMEIRALLHALGLMRRDWFPHGVKLVIYSDSQYVVKTFTEGRLQRWKKADWTGWGGGELKNVDLWKIADQALESRKDFLRLEMRHVKGHQYDKEKDKEKKRKLLEDPVILGNTIADRFADYKRHKEYIKDLEEL